jgi:hypothetical protein
VEQSFGLYLLYDIEGEVVFNDELKEEGTVSFVMRLLCRNT